MAIARSKKESIVSRVSKKAKESPVLFFVDFTGLKTSAVNQLKARLKGLDATYQVVKKSLAKLAFQKAERKADPDIFERSGALGIITAPEKEMEVAKTVYQFSKTNDALKILGGMVGENFMPSESVIKLAKLPSREVLLGQLVGVLASPMRGLVTVLNGNIQKLVMTLGAIQRSRQ